MEAEKSGAGNIADTNWHHVAVTFSSNSARIFIDGAPTATLSFSADFAFTSIAAIGRQDGGNNAFYGSIDEVSVYNRVLSADEILIIYALGSRGKNNLLSAPVFTVQPASATVANGGTATFSASVKSVLPYSCQWYFNDTKRHRGGDYFNPGSFQRVRRRCGRVFFDGEQRSGGGR